MELPFACPNKQKKEYKNKKHANGIENFGRALAVCAYKSDPDLNEPTKRGGEREGDSKTASEREQ